MAWNKNFENTNPVRPVKSVGISNNKKNISKLDHSTSCKGVIDFLVEHVLSENRSRIGPLIDGKNPFTI